MCIFGEGQKNLLRSLQIVFEGPETRRAARAEAEHTMSAGRRRRPEAVSGRRSEQGQFPNCGLQNRMSARTPIQFSAVTSSTLRALADLVAVRKFRIALERPA